MKIDPKPEAEKHQRFETGPAEPRAPRVFKLEDVIEDPATGGKSDPHSSTSGTGFARLERTHPPRSEARSEERDDFHARNLTANDLSRGIKWGSVMLSAAFALASLAATLWFTRFVSVAVQRNDWIGWIAVGLFSIIGVAAVILIGRELWGFSHLARLSRLRRDVKDATDTKDPAREKAAIALLETHYSGRPEMAWGLARLSEHKDDVLEPGEYLRLADRELLAPVDQEARRAILQSAKRVATVTALSPITWIAMAFVLFENVRMFRTVAGLYGGRPGFFGALRLAKLTVMHIIATGGVAMTDDLLGQFVGQDLLRKFSQKLGEAAFNGALTSRLGVAAVDVTRPMPFLDAEPLRVREIFGELMEQLKARKTIMPRSKG